MRNAQRGRILIGGMKGGVPGAIRAAANEAALVRQCNAERKWTQATSSPGGVYDTWDQVNQWGATDNAPPWDWATEALPICINWLAQGDDTDERIGRTVRFVGLELEMYIRRQTNAVAETDYYGIIQLVCDRSCATRDVPGPNTIFKDDEYATRIGFAKRWNRKYDRELAINNVWNYWILKQKKFRFPRYRLGAAGEYADYKPGLDFRRIRWRQKLDILTRYDENGDPGVQRIAQNALFLVCYAYPVGEATGCEFTLQYRLHYYDD